MNNMQRNFKQKAKSGIRCMAGGGVIDIMRDRNARMAEAMGDAPVAAQTPPPVVAAQPEPVQPPSKQPAYLKPIRKGLGGALMSAMGFEAGGMVRGPGTGTSDEVPAWLSNGEAVLPAKTVRTMGGPKVVHDLIEDTTGKRPASGLRSGGKYAGGFVDETLDGIKRRAGSAVNDVQRAVADPVGTLTNPQGYAAIKTQLEGNPLDDPMMGMGVGSIASKGAAAKAAISGLGGRVKSLFGGKPVTQEAPAVGGNFDAPPSSRNFQSGIRQDIVTEVPVGSTKGIDVTEAVRTRPAMDGTVRAGDQAAARAANVVTPVSKPTGSVIPGRDWVNKNPVKTGLGVAAATPTIIAAASPDGQGITTQPAIQPTAAQVAVDPAAQAGAEAQAWRDGWMGERGIRVDHNAPKLGMRQANELSRQSAGLGEQQRLDYGPNAEIYGSSSRKDGKLNNFTGIGNGQSSVSDERYNFAMQRAAKEREQLRESIIARASSGDRRDMEFAQSQAAGIPGMAEEVQQAGLRATASRRDPVAIYKQQLESGGKAADRQATLEALRIDRAEKMDDRRERTGIARQAARQAGEKYAAERGDTKLKQFESQLKDKHTVDGKLDAAAYSKERAYITQALADQGLGLSDADDQLFRDSQEAYAAGGATPRFNWAKSIFGEGVDAPKSLREGAYKARRENSLTGELELQRGDGAWIPASRVYGGGLFGGNPDLNRKRIVDAQIDTPKRGV